MKLNQSYYQSQSGIEPGTSCTAGRHSMQRAIQTALFTAIWNLGFYYYKNIFSLIFSEALNGDFPITHLQILGS
jgi:hypothetical protein